MNQHVNKTKLIPYNFFIVAFCLLISNGGIAEQPKENVHMKDIVSKFESLVTSWQEKKVAMMLVCPIIIGGDEDPFSKIKELSTASFGEFNEQSSNEFIKIMMSEEKEVMHVLDSGVDYNLVVIIKEDGFSANNNVIRCRVLNDGLVIFIPIEKEEYAVKLSKNCFEKFKATIVHGQKCR